MFCKCIDQNLVGKKLNVGAVIADTTLDPTGFKTPENVVVSYDETTRKITLSGTVDAYYRLIKITELFDGYVSPAHIDATGTYFLIYDGGSISWKSPAQVNFYDLLIAYAIYQPGFKFGLRECHGFMPWQTHYEFHNAIGTYRKSGGVIGDFTLGSTTAADRRPSVSSTILYDEDLPTTNLLLAASGNYTQFFLSSANDINFDTAAIDIVPLSGNQPYYNQFTGGAWQQTLITPNNRMSVWLVASPVTSDTESQKFRYFWVQGQTQNTTLIEETALTPDDVSLGNFGDLSPEFVFIGRIIIRYIGGNWELEYVEQIDGTRASQTQGPGGGFVPLAQENAYYVAQNGDDLNDGKNANTPFATIGAANTAIAARTPGASNIFGVFLLDGIFTEDFTEQPYTMYYGPGAKLIGEIVAVDFSHLFVSSWEGKTGVGAGVMLTKSTGVEVTRVTVLDILDAKDSQGILATLGLVNIQADTIIYGAKDFIGAGNTNAQITIYSDSQIKNIGAGNGKLINLQGAEDTLSIFLNGNSIYDQGSGGGMIDINTTGTIQVDIQSGRIQTTSRQSFNLTNGAIVSATPLTFTEPPGTPSVIAGTSELKLIISNDVNDSKKMKLLNAAGIEMEGPVRIIENIIIGNGAAGIDYQILFDGENSDGILKWLEDEALFEFSSNLVVDNNPAAGSSAELILRGGNTGISALKLGDTDSDVVGVIRYDHNVNALTFDVAGATVFTIDSSGKVGIGVTPSAKLHVVGGDIYVVNADNNPGVLVGDDTTTNFGRLFWDSANDYLRLEENGTNGIKINGNNVAIGNIFPSEPFIVGNGATQRLKVPATGSIEINDTLTVVGNIKQTVHTNDVSNPPTDAELDSIFGTPATVGAGFTAYINDNGAGNNFYQVMSDGTNWWIFTGTKAV